jgi:ATP-binding cassette subfamily B (MDR/TAP) protein 8
VDGECGAISSQTVQNIKTVRSFCAEDIEQNKYHSALVKSRNQNNKLGFHMAVFQGLVQLSIATMIGSILFFGGNMVASGEMTGEELMGFLTTTQQAQRSLGNID